MHTSSKRALGWSLRAHSTLIPGLLWGQHRSSLQHLDSLEGAKHCLIHGMLIMSQHTLSVRCTEMHHHYEVNINTVATSLSIWVFWSWPRVWTRLRGRVSFHVQPCFWEITTNLSKNSCQSAVKGEIIMLRFTGLFAYLKIKILYIFPTASKVILPFSLQDKYQCYS